jgi:hypothetical protein
MNIRTGLAGRLTGLTITVLAAGAAAAGCGTAQPEAAAPPTAKETLLASVPDGSEGPFRFSGRDATTQITGAVDHAAKALELNTSAKDPEHGFTTHVSFLIVDAEIWTKIRFTGAKGLTGLPKLPKRWLRLDRARLTDGGSVPTYEGADPGNAGVLIEAASAVRDEGSGRYAGTVDLSTGEAAKVLGAEETAALGEAAKRVPFTATVGADQHLASLVLEVPAAGAGKAFQYVVNYRDYGTAPKLAPPAGGQAQEAPALAYEVLNG